MDSTCSTPTWKLRERSHTGDKVETSKSLGKKRVAKIEVEQSNSKAKRFQAAFRDETTPSVMAGVNVQPRQEQ